MVNDILTPRPALATDDDTFFGLLTAARAAGLHVIKDDGSLDLTGVKLTRRPEKSQLGRSWRVVLGLPGGVTKADIEKAADREAGKALTSAQAAVVNVARLQALAEIGGPSTASYPTAEPRKPKRRSYRRMR
ncbi:hypothetical protein [Bradyrhizobium liaoningense]|uniref:hypothetical protein n=1 Tax=Bradyrhizobium liaoningense TaxID=43992 RepID=UPI001BA67D9B|nr:hypothetical protein [Bradyrhizobium liaoningense]MBR0712680.1 hypothetical protein [Bradyrhizobium liaoningense]